MTYQLPIDLLEAVRDVAYWERATVNATAATLIRRGIDALEAERKEPFNRRP